MIGGSKHDLPGMFTCGVALLLDKKQGAVIDTVRLDR